MPQNVHRMTSNATTTNATLVKAGPGRVFKIRGYTGAPALRYLKIYNMESVPVVGTNKPLMTIPLRPSMEFDIDFGRYGLVCDVGIAFAITTGVSDLDATALTVNDVVGLNIIFE